LTLYAVRIKEVENYKYHAYLVEAKTENHAKNLAEAKWYETHNIRIISEGETEVWEVEADYSNRDNPSVRT
jgi:hypothetical protein